MFNEQHQSPEKLASLQEIFETLEKDSNDCIIQLEKSTKKLILIQAEILRIRNHLEEKKLTLTDRLPPSIKTSIEKAFAEQAYTLQSIKKLNLQLIELDDAIQALETTSLLGNPEVAEA